MLILTLMFACGGLAVGLTALWLIGDSTAKVKQETMEFVEEHALKTSQVFDKTNVKLKNLAIKIAKLEDRILSLAQIPDNAAITLSTLEEDVATLKNELGRIQKQNSRPPRMHAARPRVRLPHRFGTA